MSLRQSFQVAVSLVLPAVVNEFKFRGPLLILGQNIGALVGASFWGIGADLIGRRYYLFPFCSGFHNLMPQYSRLAFNVILFIQGVFALAAGGAPNWIALTSLVAVLSTGFSGTLPVDAAIFLGEWMLSRDFERETEIL